MPHGDDWPYEVKFDGYRAVAYIRGGECKLVSRNGNDLTGRFPEVAKAIVKAVEEPERRHRRRGLRGSTDAAGRASPSSSTGPGRLVYYAFDLLELDGEPLVDLPLTERRRGCASCSTGAARRSSCSEDFEDGDALLRGGDSSRARGRHRQAARAALPAGPPHARLAEAQDGERAGVRRRRLHARRRAPRRHVRVARARASTRAASCATSATSAPGFDDAEIRKLLKLLRPLERATSPFPVAPKMPRVRKGDVQWVEPRLVAEVRVRRVDARRPPPPPALPRASARTRTPAR